jgi:hypothetical protein
MSGEMRRGVGFLAGNVGSVSGFREEPDTSFANRISRLDRKCRKCQVFLAGESRGGFEEIANRDHDTLNPLIIRDLNDVLD